MDFEWNERNHNVFPNDAGRSFRLGEAFPAVEMFPVPGDGSYCWCYGWPSQCLRPYHSHRDIHPACRSPAAKEIGGVRAGCRCGVPPCRMYCKLYSTLPILLHRTRTVGVRSLPGHAATQLSGAGLKAACGRAGSEKVERHAGVRANIRELDSWKITVSGPHLSRNGLIRWIL